MLAAALAGLPLPVLAQVPDVASPPTREEIERGAIEGALREAGRPVEVEAEVERAPCPLAAPEFEGIRFTLSAVEFRGTEAVPGIDLSGATDGLIGQDLPVAAVCEIRDRAATQLRAQGYLAAVQVPPQTIETGRVVFDVLFARLSRVQIRGDAGASEGLLLRTLDKLRSDGVFNVRKAERYLLLARDIPGLDARLVLRPVEGTPGEVIGEISVLRTPVTVDANVQNLGTRSVGRWGGLLRARFAGLTGLGDVTTFGAFSTLEFEEQQVVQLGHALRIGSEGFGLSGDFTYAWTRPDIGGLNIRSETLSATVEANYPFLRRESRTVIGGVGLDIVDQDVAALGAPLTRDRLRVLYGRLDLVALDPGSVSGRGGYTAGRPLWAARAGLELRHGVSDLDPGPVAPSRADGDATAFVLRLSTDLEARPTPDWTVAFAMRMQYAPDALLSYEEISGGNYTIGRGYDPGTITGDSGIGVRGELRFGSTQPEGPRDLALEPFVFADALWLWNEDRGSVGEPLDLAAMGGGLRARFGNGATLEAMVAAPLVPAGLQRETGPVRFLLNASFQLLPWRYGR